MGKFQFTLRLAVKNPNCRKAKDVIGRKPRINDDLLDTQSNYLDHVDSGHIGIRWMQKREIEEKRSEESGQ